MTPDQFRQLMDAIYFVASSVRVGVTTLMVVGSVWWLLIYLETGKDK